MSMVMSQSYHPKGQGFFEYCHSAWERKCIHVPFVRGTPQITTVYTSHFSGWWYKALPWTLQCFEKKTSSSPEKNAETNPKRKGKTSSSKHQFFRSKGFRPKIPVTLNSPRTIQFFRNIFFMKVCPKRSPNFFYNPKMLFLYGIFSIFTYKNWVVTNGGFKCYGTYTADVRPMG